MSSPSYSSLVSEAISTLKERGGSSLAAIKKYLAGKKVDIVKGAHHLRAAIKNGVKKGTFVQVKGSFKLGEKKAAPKKKKVVKAKKPKAPKVAKAPKKAAAKKAAPKKAAAKKAAPKKAAAKKAAPKKAVAKK